MESIDKLRQFIIEEFPVDATGHDYLHIFRVHDIAKHIHSKEGGDWTVIQLASLLHDVSDHKFNGGNWLEGGTIAYNKVIELGYSQEIATHVKECVNSTSFKGANVADQTNSIEAKIVQDADRLEALGAIGIARTFAYGGSKNNPIYNPDISPVLHDSADAYSKGNSHTINHFHEKLLLLTKMMHTPTARKIGEQRTQLMSDFLEQFHLEWETKF